MTRLPRYLGDETANTDYHDGQLKPIVGVHSFQVLRANRRRPWGTDNRGFTYNHAPMLAYWGGRFVMEFLSSPISEREPPCVTLITTSVDGRTWSTPEIVFPEYRFPDGVYQGPEPLQLGNLAVMHQRQGLYVAPSGRLLVLGFYGVCATLRTGPNDGFGIGRAVREMYDDGTFGPIYFLRLNRHAGWREDNVLFPMYETSADEGFIEACEALLSDKLGTLSWWEEERTDDEFHRVRGQKSPSHYHVENGQTVAVWKNAVGAVSNDDGQSWTEPEDLHQLPNATNKVWAQRTSDGRYAMVWTPSASRRWPLAVVTSDDGFHFHDLRAINGDVSPRRYYGRTKDFGLNYVRGIAEGNGHPPDGAMWLTYSMNKEDIWISRVPVPLVDTADDGSDVFHEGLGEVAVPGWNLYSPLWSKVQTEKSPGEEGTSLVFRSADPYDYAKAVRVFAEGAKKSVTFRISAQRPHSGVMHVELVDARGQRPVRLTFTPDCWLTARDGKHVRRMIPVRDRRWYTVTISVDCTLGQFNVDVDGERVSTEGYARAHGYYFAAAAASITRVEFRTGALRREPNDESGTTLDLDLPNSEVPADHAIYYLSEFTVRADG